VVRFEVLEAVTNSLKYTTGLPDGIEENVWIYEK
jgi:hypothetical protein